MNITFGKKLCVLSISLSIVLNLGAKVDLAQSAVGEKAEGKLYSNGAAKGFCKKAQQIIANTKLKAKNINWSEFGTAGTPFPPPAVPATGFIGSDAKPYDGAENLPLETQQYVSYGKDDKGKIYPQVILCKMKSSDALDFYYPGSAAFGASCAAINVRTTAKVVARLTKENREPLIGKDLVYYNWLTYSGQQWTDSSPTPVAFRTSDGKLHIVSKELYVERTNPSSFVGSEKKGINYCQVIAPEYLRKLLLDNIMVPECDAPPVYQQSPTQPEPPKTWNCANP